MAGSFRRGWWDRRGGRGSVDPDGGAAGGGGAGDGVEDPHLAAAVGEARAARQGALGGARDLLQEGVRLGAAPPAPVRAHAADAPRAAVPAVGAPGAAEPLTPAAGPPRRGAVGQRQLAGAAPGPASGPAGAE